MLPLCAAAIVLVLSGCADASQRGGATAQGEGSVDGGVSGVADAVAGISADSGDVVGAADDAGDAAGTSDAVPSDAAKRGQENAVAFVRGWYDDWSFSSGAMRENDTPVLERVLPYVASGSALYDELRQSGGMHGAALCALGTKVKPLGDDAVQLTVDYVSAQNDVDQATYDDMAASPQQDVIKFTFDDEGLLVAAKGLLL